MDMVYTSLAQVGWSEGCLCDFVRVRELHSPVFEIKRVPLDACPVHGVADLCGSEEEDFGSPDGLRGAEARREDLAAVGADLQAEASIGHVISFPAGSEAQRRRGEEVVSREVAKPRSGEPDNSSVTSSIGDDSEQPAALSLCASAPRSPSGDHPQPCLFGECGSGPLFYAVIDLSDPARTFRLEGFGFSMLLDEPRARGMIAALEFGLNRISAPVDRA